MSMGNFAYEENNKHDRIKTGENFLRIEAAK